MLMILFRFQLRPNLLFSKVEDIGKHKFCNFEKFILQPLRNTNFFAAQNYKSSNILKTVIKNYKQKFLKFPN